MSTRKKSCFFIVFWAIFISVRPAVCAHSGGLPDKKLTKTGAAYSPKEPAYRVRFYNLHLAMDTLALVARPGSSGTVFPIRGRVEMHLEKRRENRSAQNTRGEMMGNEMTEGQKIRGNKDSFWVGLEFDAGPQLLIDSLFIGQHPISFERRGTRVCVDAHSIAAFAQSEFLTLICFFRSDLIPAKKPPWQDGVVVSTDNQGRPWLGMTCQTSGASSWWPCLDRLSEEPDSVLLTFDMPDVGAELLTNGQQQPVEKLPGQRVRYRARVSYPINLYNITFNIGHYASFTLPFRDLKGVERHLEFHMLEDGVQQAKAYFTESQTMMQGFEAVFGPYAFWRDGYKVVETHYWGMEHQSCVAYGNHLKRNKYGFDFILVHESAHEWWGNAVSACRPHDLWIHEGLATWSESRLLEWRHPDSSVYIDYLVGLRERILNRQRVAPATGTNKRKPDTDVYYKAAWMWHSLRHSVPSKSRFDEVLKEFYQHYIYKNLDTRQLTDYWCKQLGEDYKGFFNHYLHKKHLPVLRCRKIASNGKGEHTLKLSYKRVSRDFHMPIHLSEGVCSIGRDQAKSLKVQGNMEEILEGLKRKYLIEVKYKTN
jgi:aminopeptidase N